MPDINIPLTILGTDAITLLPDGTEYITGTIGNLPKAIAEKKRIRWKFSTTYPNIGDTNIWVSIGLFNQGVINTPPAITKAPIDYAGTFNSALTAGTYPLALMLPIGANLGLLNNASVSLEILTSSTFNIVVDFFQIYDELTYQAQSNQDNHNKLLKDCKIAPSELTISPFNTCYNSTAGSFCITMRLEKPNQIHLPDTYPYTDNGNPAMGAQWAAGFYNRDANDNPSTFTNPTFLLSRSAVAVTNLMSTINTDVKFQITAPLGGTVDKILMWIIRTDKFDNTVDMVTNYESNWEDIISTNANIGATGNKFTTPVVNIALLSGTTYEVGFSIKGTNLQNGAKYRLIATVYDVTGDKAVNSFISDEYLADGLPCYDGNGFDVHAVLDDYNQQWEGNQLYCSIEERMRSKIKLNFAFDKWKNDLFNRLGIVAGNDIRRYLVNVSVSIYEAYNDPSFGDIVNVFDYKTSAKVGVSSYVPQSGLTMDFSNTWAELQYEWRNRFESWVPCIGTLVNNVNTIPVLGNQYWGGKTLTIKWVLTFNYDDIALPFTEDIVINQNIFVRDYGGLTLQADGEDARKELSSFCVDDENCFFATLNDSSLTDRKLIVNVYPVNGTINSIEEAEVWEGNQLPQMTTDKVYDEDEDFVTEAGEKTAHFCIDGSKFILNSQYTISAMAKKYSYTGFRITEKNNPSVFEQRITDQNNGRRITN